MARCFPLNGGRGLLASDLDGTLIPPPGIPGDQGVTVFAGVFEAAGAPLLAYVTGRHFELALDGILAAGLPLPDALACDVGTSVYLRDGDAFNPDSGYRTLMQQAFGGVSAESIMQVLEAVGSLQLQESENQAPFKVSYYFDADSSVPLQVGDLLSAATVRANVVTSVDPVSGEGLMDVLPAGVAKDRAVGYLADQGGIDSDHVVYAGDSGNDSAAMLSGLKSILVGNAVEHFKEYMRGKAREAGLADRIYFAEEPFARGVLEGCRHFGLF